MPTPQGTGFGFVPHMQGDPSFVAPLMVAEHEFGGSVKHPMLVAQYFCELHWDKPQMQGVTVFSVKPSVLMQGALAKQTPVTPNVGITRVDWQ